MSCALRGAELNYAITDAEGLALVVALRQWRQYVASSPALCITDHVALKSLVGSKEHASSQQTRYALDLQEYDLEIIHRAGARHHIADIISRTPTATVAATSVMPVSEEMEHYYSMVQEVSTPGIVPTNPEAFEKMPYQKVNLVGSKRCIYQDSQMFGEAIGQQSLANALDHASIPAESIATLTPDVNTARALLTQLHGDTFRQQRAWQSRKPIDPDPSRTLEMWETICELDEMQEQYTVDSDSDYKPDTEMQPCHAQAEPMIHIAPIDLSATRAALRSASKEKASTSIPPISQEEIETPASPTLEAGIQLKLPTRAEFISAQTAMILRMEGPSGFQASPNPFH